MHIAPSIISSSAKGNGFNVRLSSCLPEASPASSIINSAKLPCAVLLRGGRHFVLLYFVRLRQVYLEIPQGLLK